MLLGSLRGIDRRGSDPPAMSLFEVGEPMDLEHPDAKAGGSSCSICLDLVHDLGGRSIAKLHCGHEFHLDCIGSAFNAKGAMQCPNCRKVEKGQWLYANGHRPSSDFDLDGWMAEDFYDLSYSELPFGFHWCPVRELTQLASLFEESEHHLHSLLGDHPSSSSSTHVCPYMALRGIPHPVHPAPSSAAESIPENGPFHRHPTGVGGQFSGEMINSHNLSATERQIHNWQQQPPLSYSTSGNHDQSAAQLASRLSRADASTQQRLGSFVHPHNFVHGHVARSQPVIGEVRGHSRGHGGAVYQQSAASSSSLRPSSFAPIRRTRPRALAVLSSTVSSADIGGFYGLSRSGSLNRNHQDGEGINRNFEQFYGWGREGESSTLPWIPAGGESQWWGPFHPSHNPPPASVDPTARNFYAQRAPGERVTRSRPENGYHQMPLPQMPPYM